ncbi:MAG: ATP-binding protein [Pseudobdellovibrionaceae bacterium]|jgi:PAS domain S-box-containing protein|nr:ATP-binding protein [Pseudobdellovibrionaceae bacterium]
MSGFIVDHKALFETMPIPRFLVSMDQENGYTICEINRRGLEYFNRKEQQIVGFHVSQLMDSENARHFEQAFEVCARQKVPVSIHALPSFPGGLRVYGFWINPLLDMTTGNVVMLDVMAQPDSADDSVLQRERDDAISLLTSIFDASNVGIIVTDRNRRVVRVNDSFVRVYGWQREQIVGEDFITIISPDEQEPTAENYERYLKSSIRSSGEMKMLKKDGSVVNTLYTTATLELSQRRRFQVTTLMDITLRKQMEMSLRVAKDQADAANHAKSAFLANMSHELRTPLNAIIGFSEIMMNGTFGEIENPKYQEYMRDVHSSARHLLEIINEVLDMSKIEAGRVELDEHEVNIKDVIESVVRMMASRAFSANISLKTKMPMDLPALQGDPRLVRQVLINLVSNAVKFSKNGGYIMISAESLVSGEVEITVEDNGVGIPKDKIAQALEPFGQIHETATISKENMTGTGLGLPLAKAMVELHGGYLSLSSELGMGTSVKVTFPRNRVLRRAEISAFY